MGVPIRRAGGADREGVVRLLDEAFFHDPVSSWIFPREADRRRTHKVLMGVFLDSALAEGYVDITDDASAAALWLPITGDVPDPGRGGDRPAAGSLARPTPETVVPAAGPPADRPTAARADDPAALREAVDPGNERIEQIARVTMAAHPTHTAHEYLMFIAVAPALAGQGLGTALLTHALDRLDREARPAYLEASSARSRALYERVGFRLAGAPLTLPGGPPMYPLWRAPRPRR
jgi:GNAT superfamily N-acetyltransferase